MASKTTTKSSEMAEINKIVKLFAMKVIQIVVQSRLGGKLRTYSKPHSYGTDYFGVAINDLPNVLAVSKDFLSSESIKEQIPFSIEISVKTVDDSTMVLESWMLALAPTPPNEDEQTSQDLYNKMTLMLKTLLSTTRLMPSYKISRNQDPDAYNIYYHLHVGKYDVKSLGDKYKTVDFAKISLGKDSLYMSVVYRTKMVFASQPIQIVKQTEENASPVVKPKRIVDLNKPMKAGAFVDTSCIKEFSDTNFILPEEPPYSWLLELVQEKNEYDYMKKQEFEEVVTGEEAKENAESNPSNEKDENKELKFMKELNCPFASESPLTELARFYRDFFFAPSLQEFDAKAVKDSPPPKECTSCESHEDDITNQLKELENSLPEYERMVTDLCQFSNEYI